VSIVGVWVDDVRKSAWLLVQLTRVLACQLRPAHGRAVPHTPYRRKVRRLCASRGTLSYMCMYIPALTAALLY
jgi:hypothetical protein